MPNRTSLQVKNYAQQYFKQKVSHCETKYDGFVITVNQEILAKWKFFLKLNNDQRFSV